MPSEHITNHNSERALRHHEYYIEGADLIIRVENTLFRVHRFFLKRDSAYFRIKLPHPPSPGDVTKGSSDNNPLDLEDALTVDFERLLWVFYNPKYSIYDATTEEWTSILKLSHQWDLIEVKALAIRELENLQIPALQKIVIYQKYAVDRKYLQAAFTALAVRDEPITIEEGRELGLETALQVARAREAARAPVFSGKRSGNPRSPVNIAGAELDALMRETFQLSPPDGASSTSQAPTGRGTPIGDRDSPQLSTQTSWSGFSSLNLPQGVSNGRANGHANDTTNGSTLNGTFRSMINASGRLASK